MNKFFMPKFRLWTGPQTISYFKLKLSLCICAPEHLNCDRKTIREDLNGQSITNLRNLTPKITKISFNLKIKTSSPPTPYYSREHISSTSHFS